MSTTKLSIVRLGISRLGSDESGFTGSHGQAQADIKQTYLGFAQAQSFILPTYGSGQAQAGIKQIYFASGQAQSKINVAFVPQSTAKLGIARLGISRLGSDEQEQGGITGGFGQAQADIKAIVNQFAQSQADIKQIYQAYAQAQALLLNRYEQCGQAQAQIIAFNVTQFGQAQSDIKQVYQSYGQTQADIKQTYFGHGQSQADIKQTYFASGQAQAFIVGATQQQFAQAQAKINAFNVNAHAQAQALIIASNRGFAQAQAVVYKVWLFDSFSRTTGAGVLGSPNIGPAYTNVSASLSVDGSALQYDNNVSPFNGRALSPRSGQPESFIGQIDITSSTFNNLYFEVSTESGSYIYIDSPFLVIDDEVSSSISLTNGVTYTLKWLVLNQGDVKVKIWQTGQPEPVSWNLTNTGFTNTGTGYYIFFDFSSAQVDNYYILENGEFLNTKWKAGLARAVIYKFFQGLPNAQAQAFIRKSTGFAQANADIKTTYNRFAQAQAIINQGMGAGQAQAFILGVKHAQAQGRIKRVDNQFYAQAQAEIVFSFFGFGQAQAKINSFNNTQHGQANALISSTSKVEFGQAQALISVVIWKDTFTRSTSPGVLGTPDIGLAYANLDLDEPAFINGSQLEADFDAPNNHYIYFEEKIQAKDVICYFEFRYSVVSSGQYIEFAIRKNGPPRFISLVITNGTLLISRSTTPAGSHNPSVSLGAFTVSAGVTYGVKLKAQGNTVWAKIWDKSGTEPDWFGSTTADLDQNFGDFWVYIDNDNLTTIFLMDNINVETLDQNVYFTKFAQARARIKLAGRQQYAQSQAYITGQITGGYAQAQAFIDKSKALAQAQALIIGRGYPTGQARAFIKEFNYNFAQALATIKGKYIKSGQAQAYIRPNIAHAQAQARIKNVLIKAGQANALIDNGQKTGQAQGYITGGRYLVNYNSYNLPGYAQRESIESVMEIVQHAVAFKDMSLSEHYGLKNKLISITMLVWEENYAAAKTKIREAATIIRSRKKGFSPLYVQRDDRHYDALAKRISYESSAESSGRIVNYDIEFETKPWLIGNTTHTLSGIGTITTDQISRDIYNGGWSPVTVQVTGTNVTISGYTETGEFSGFVSVSGTVNNLEINTENHTATISGINRNDVMNTVDYGLHVGPGKTTFAINGATSCIIVYRDRWYL